MKYFMIINKDLSVGAFSTDNEKTIEVVKSAHKDCIVFQEISEEQFEAIMEQLK